MYTLKDSIPIPESLLITLMSMAIVFLTLLVISFMLDLFKKFFYKEPKKEVKVVETRPQVEEVQEESNDEELVAVIAAAIAAHTSNSIENINIKSIRRVAQNSTAWTMAGRNEQIR